MARGHHVPKRVLSRAGVAALLVFMIAGGVSCDLFETRTPTDPGTSRFPCLSLDAPGTVFTNISRAYGRGDGLGCYLSTLDDIAFAFHADPADSIANIDKFASWPKAVEIVVAQNIANDADSFFLQLKEPPVIVATQPEAEVRRYPYEIKFKGKAVSDTLFQGLAEITVRKNTGGQWLVRDWVDRRDPAGTTSLTWGYLRVSYRIGI